MKRHVRPRRSQPGFTLIEMIIAAILLVIGVAGALGAIGASTREEFKESEGQAEKTEFGI